MAKTSSQPKGRSLVSISKARKFVPDEVDRWIKIYLEGKGGKSGGYLLSESQDGGVYGQVLSDADQGSATIDGNYSFDMDLALVDNVVYLTAFEDQEMQVTVIKSPPLYRSLSISKGKTRPKCLPNLKNSAIVSDHLIGLLLWLLYPLLNKYNQILRYYAAF